MTDEILLKAVEEVTRFHWPHCSNHLYWASGCPDCSTIYLLAGEDDPGYFKKVGSQRLAIEIANPNPRFQLIRQQLARVFAVFFAKSKRKAATAAISKTREFIKSEKKEFTDEEKMAIVYAAVSSIQWDALINGVVTDLFAAAQAGAIEGLMQFQISPTDEVLSNISDIAENYAKNRAAEMIGMKYEDDKLVSNPSAKFVIAETTADDLHDIIEHSLEKGESLTQLQERIIASATFSDLRSQLISKTEVSMAQVKGHLNVWKHVGNVKKVGIMVSDEHDVIDECDDLAEEGPYDINHVPLIPAHPNCQCTIYVIEEAQSII